MPLISSTIKIQNKVLDDFEDNDASACSGTVDLNVLESKMQRLREHVKEVYAKAMKDEKEQQSSRNESPTKKKPRC